MIYSGGEYTGATLYSKAGSGKYSLSTVTGMRLRVGDSHRLIIHLQQKDTGNKILPANDCTGNCSKDNTIGSLLLQAEHT